MGFGFVELASLTAARAAVKALQVWLSCATAAGDFFLFFPLVGLDVCCLVCKKGSGGSQAEPRSCDKTAGGARQGLLESSLLAAVCAPFAAQGSVLAGHALALQISKHSAAAGPDAARAEPEAGAKGKLASPKILVRNVVRLRRPLLTWGSSQSSQGPAQPQRQRPLYCRGACAFTACTSFGLGEFLGCTAFTRVVPSPGWSLHPGGPFTRVVLSPGWSLHPGGTLNLTLFNPTALPCSRLASIGLSGSVCWGIVPVPSAGS